MRRRGSEARGSACAEGRAKLGRERRHATAARRAVVEVLLRELVAPGAEAQVLDRPGQPRCRGRERKELAQHLELLAGLAVAVDGVGLGFDEDLAPGRRGAQSIELASHARTLADEL